MEILPLVLLHGLNLAECHLAGLNYLWHNDKLYVLVYGVSVEVWEFENISFPYESCFIGTQA